MPEPTGQSPTSGDPDASLKPRQVSSRHFRQPGETSAPTPAPDDPTAEERPSGGDEELAELTQKFKDLVGRKRTIPAEPAAEEDTKVRRKPMPRSGNVNMSVLVGDPHSPVPRPRLQEKDSPELVLPAGLGALAWKLVAVAAVMFGLGYFVATLLRPAPPPAAGTAAVPEPPSVWGPASLETLNQAVAADRAGDLQTATTLLTALATSDPRLPGLVRYLADLHVRQGNYIAADTALLAQVNSGREVAPAFYLRAFNAARQRHFDDASKFLQSSIAIDPLSADPFYQMAELMRRQGKWPDAVENGRQALLRVRPGHGISPASIGLKMRLAQIEAGQIPEVESALAEASKSSPLSADWLFTAAALSLQKGDLAAAAGSLEKARDAMPRDEFNSWIEDYFFRQYTGQPGLAGLRPSEEERRLRSQASWDFNLDP